jgi:predicted transcriptional regulator
LNTHENTTPTLTPQELAIMKLVWRKDEATVRDVYEALQETRPVAYTTVMTMMRILQEKGYLTKATNDRATSTAREARQQVIGGMVATFSIACSTAPPTRCSCTSRATTS